MWLYNMFEQALNEEYIMFTLNEVERYITFILEKTAPQFYDWSKQYPLIFVLFGLVFMYLFVQPQQQVKRVLTIKVTWQEHLQTEQKNQIMSKLIISLITLTTSLRHPINVPILRYIWNHQKVMTSLMTIYVCHNCKCCIRGHQIMQLITF